MSPVSVFVCSFEEDVASVETSVDSSIDSSEVDVSTTSVDESEPSTKTSFESVFSYAKYTELLVRPVDKTKAASEI